MKKTLAHILSALLCIVLMHGCKPSVSGDYIQPGDMEDLLYDYQLAQAMGSQPDDGGQMPTDVDRNVYKMAVLRKHGITQQQFDASLQYYFRHTDELHKIYEHLADRLTREANTLGANAADFSQYGVAQQGDTANVWNKAPAFIISPDEGLNRLSFAIKADTAFHKGDKLMLNFDSKYIVQDGSREAIAVLMVKYANDSITAQNTRITSTSHYSLTIPNNGRLAIKEVRGYFYIGRGEGDSQTTLKLLNVYNVQLVRMHTAEPKAEVLKPDSLRGNGAPKPDSLRQNGAPKPILAK